MKLKTFKLQRDSKKNIIQQIEWLKIHLGDDFDCDYIKSIYPLKKSELIVIWEELVCLNKFPQLDWMMIYY